MVTTPLVRGVSSARDSYKETNPPGSRLGVEFCFLFAPEGQETEIGLIRVPPTTLSISAEAQSVCRVSEIPIRLRIFPLPLRQRQPEE